MNLSLSEVEAIAKKASRGVKYSWGMAEEAGFATAWLCRHGVDGCQLLASLLTQIDKGKHPTAENCPLTAGAALSDQPTALDRQAKEYDCMITPALLLPFASSVASALEKPVSLSWTKIKVVTDGTSLSISGPNTALLVPTADRTLIAVGGVLAEEQPRQTRAFPDKGSWEILTKLAHRTYAPSTDASRVKGAGAGLTDND